MIYICYIIYQYSVATCVLAVGDDELTMRDDDDMLSEVAEDRACAGELRKFTWLDKQSHPASWLQFTGIPVDHGNQKMT